MVLEGVDGRYSNLVGSLHYTDSQGGTVKNLALELVQLVRRRFFSKVLLPPSCGRALVHRQRQSPQGLTETPGHGFAAAQLRLICAALF